MKNKKALLRRTVIYSALLSLYALILYFLGISCPIYAITGVKCPTCGVTRALISLLRFDLKGYLTYNFMALPLLISAWFIINADLFSKRKFATVLSLAVIVLNFLLYLVKTFICIL